MNKYYVVQSVCGSSDLLKLGTCLYAYAVKAIKMIYYTDIIVLVNNNFEAAWYKKYPRILIKESLIREFEDDEEALLWYKLNY